METEPKPVDNPDLPETGDDSEFHEEFVDKSEFMAEGDADADDTVDNKENVG